MDKTSFVSFVGEGAGAVGEGLPEAGMDPASQQVASWEVPTPGRSHALLHHSPLDTAAPL